MRFAMIDGNKSESQIKVFEVEDVLLPAYLFISFIDTFKNRSTKHKYTVLFLKVNE